MLLPRLLCIFIAALPTTFAIHASEAGVVDWYKPLVGDTLTGNPQLLPVFHRIGDGDGNVSTRSLVLTATKSNVLAALFPENGTIGTLASSLARRVGVTNDDKCSMETYTGRQR